METADIRSWRATSPARNLPATLLLIRDRPSPHEDLVGV
jgi:hypothetical protein